MQETGICPFVVDLMSKVISSDYHPVVISDHAPITLCCVEQIWLWEEVYRLGYAFVHFPSVQHCHKQYSNIQSSFLLTFFQALGKVVLSLS